MLTFVPACSIFSVSLLTLGLHVWVSGRDYGITCDVVEYTNGALPISTTQLVVEKEA